jgi:hypothetical protein
MLNFYTICKISHILAMCCYYPRFITWNVSLGSKCLYVQLADTISIRNLFFIPEIRRFAYAFYCCDLLMLKIKRLIYALKICIVIKGITVKDAPLIICVLHCFIVHDSQSIYWDKPINMSRVVLYCHIDLIFLIWKHINQLFFIFHHAISK